jgi:hypothetical protein
VLISQQFGIQISHVQDDQSVKRGNSFSLFTEAADLLDEQCDSGRKAEEPLKMQTESLCRVCACESEELVPVFGQRGSELELLEKIHIHLPIMVKTYTNAVLLFCVLVSHLSCWKVI